MTAEKKKENGLTTGNILTIIIMISGFVVSYGSTADRLARIETNLDWTTRLLESHIRDSKTQVGLVAETYKEQCKISSK
jgi:ABC-type antimicrobial peptide transport system ATPase subunit